MGVGRITLDSAIPQMPADRCAAHDLDEDNRMLLRARKISAVLHHDLWADAISRAG